MVVTAAVAYQGGRNGIEWNTRTKGVRGEQSGRSAITKVVGRMASIGTVKGGAGYNSYAF